MKTLLWLDDIRNPFIGDWCLNYAPEYDRLWDKNNPNEIIWVKSYDEFINWFIENNRMPDMICFDHDLGETMTGYDAAKYVVAICSENNWPLPDINIQSANPVGRDNIHSLFTNYTKYYNQNNNVSPLY